MVEGSMVIAVVLDFMVAGTGWDSDGDVETYFWEQVQESSISPVSVLVLEAINQIGPGGARKWTVKNHFQHIFRE